MTKLLDRLFRLWTDALPGDEEAAAAFRALYSDPVSVNGVPMDIPALVERARLQQKAFADRQVEVLDEVEAPGKLTVVFRQRGRHVGPLATPLGEVAPTWKFVERQVIDVLTIVDGRVVDVRVVADDLGLLVRLEAVSLAEAHDHET